MEAAHFTQYKKFYTLLIFPCFLLVFSVWYLLSILYCLPYNFDYHIYLVVCILFTVNCSMSNPNVHSTIQRSQYTTPWSLYTAHCFLNNVYHIMFPVHCILSFYIFTKHCSSSYLDCRLFSEMWNWRRGYIGHCVQLYCLDPGKGTVVRMMMIVINMMIMTVMMGKIVTGMIMMIIIMIMMIMLMIVLIVTSSRQPLSLRKNVLIICCVQIACGGHALSCVVTRWPTFKQAAPAHTTESNCMQSQHISMENV